MRFDDADVLHRVLELSIATRYEASLQLPQVFAHALHCIYGHLREQFRFRAKDLGTECCLYMTRNSNTHFRHVEEHVVIDQITRHQQVLTNITHTLFQCKTVTTHNDGWVDRQVNEVQTVLLVIETMHKVPSTVQQRR